MIEGVAALKSKLKEMRRQSQAANVTAIAGFIQTYTFYVHEDLTAAHKAGTSAKFLEIPSVAYRMELASTIADYYRRTGDMPGALLAAARLLVTVAQQICPVETGALRASGYACLEQDHEAVASEAFRRSQAIRRAA